MSQFIPEAFLLFSVGVEAFQDIEMRARKVIYISNMYKKT